jgi:hypothetical protein
MFIYTKRILCLEGKGFFFIQIFLEIKNLANELPLIIINGKIMNIKGGQ